MKVVINKQFGGFGLSEAAYLKLNEYGIPIVAPSQEVPEGEIVIRDIDLADEGESGEMLRRMKPLSGRYFDNTFRHNYESRANPLLVRVVEEIGEAANGRFAELKVVEIPDDVQFEIDDYDGIETIHEVHRSWN